MVKLVVCPYCGSRVGVSNDEFCPSCRKSTVDGKAWVETEINSATDGTAGPSGNVTSNATDRRSIDLSAQLVPSGRRLTITCYTLLILAGFAAEAGAWLATGVPDPVLGPLWILLNSTFFYFTWRGKKWSHYVAAVINGLPAFTMMFIFVVTLLGRTQQVRIDTSAVREILMVLVTIAWIGIPSAILLVSSRVRAFVASRSNDEPEAIEQ